ncbi:Gfo/Idh/MocA family protein [Rhizobium sp. L1K21]|uniref:Gfo/Idh/MocA family protein n=1 Tax=Rhizobium sp. L1K21 TaxID=2954933 RepID=UPI002091FD97|nr:Gfo/Idh/MocA family oxidoreductase [Rhizobium sp. L1K21]MCO6187809.1 Gfo/Idh/MocA family oxidoreductase [Rhizobium sp. L1K21]
MKGDAGVAENLEIVRTSNVEERAGLDRRPRIGFLGAGWIGRNRLEAIAKSGLAEIAAIADTNSDALDALGKVVPDFRPCLDEDTLLACGLDGVVIATPTGLHAAQAERFLKNGVAVFCQKPLARDAQQTRRVVDIARQSDRLLDVDFSYRQTSGLQAIKRAIAAGEVGDVFAVDLAFHNAYGPDKAWYRDKALSGGGCVADLGVHLVDAVLWCLDFPEIASVKGQLFRVGQALTSLNEIEDFAVADIRLKGGTVIRLSCSWNAHAGKDAEISAHFWGRNSSYAWRNVEGSFFDFVTRRLHGTGTELLHAGEEEWGGRAAVNWVRDLARSRHFNPAAEKVVRVAEVLDGIYGRAPAQALACV